MRGWILLPSRDGGGPRWLRQMLETAVRAETLRGEGGMEKVKEKVEKRQRQVSEREKR